MRWFRTEHDYVSGLYPWLVMAVTQSCVDKTWEKRDINKGTSHSDPVSLTSDPLLLLMPTTINRLPQDVFMGLSLRAVVWLD
jgi:hypothetical protein